MKNINKYINRIDIVLSDESKEFLKSDDMFYDTLNGVMVEINLTPEDIADKVPISVGTVQRWTKNKSAPLHMMRRPVYLFLLRKLLDAVSI